PVEAVAAVAEHLAGLADIAELLGQLQQPDLGSDDLLFLGHGWSPYPRRWAGRGPSPQQEPRPAHRLQSAKTNTVCQIKSELSQRSPCAVERYDRSAHAIHCVGVASDRAGRPSSR